MPVRSTVVMLALLAALIAAVAGTGTAGGALPFAACDAGRTVPATARRHCLPSSRLVVRFGSTRLRPAWRGTFRHAGPAGWSAISELPGDIATANAPHIGGLAGLFRVGPGDSPVASGERAEVVASQQAIAGYPGTEAWYAWSTYFPLAFGPVPQQTWNIFTQWHETNPDECHPNVMFAVDTVRQPAQIRLTVRGGALDTRTCLPSSNHSWELVPLALGHWYDFVLHVRWSADPAAGLVELAINGRLVLARTPIPTLYAGQGVYAKQGFYRAPYVGISRIYQGGLTRLRTG
jgi:hypothetical protein